MAAPNFVAAGSAVRSTGALTVDWPTPHAVGDVALLFVETAGEAPTLSTPAGFALVSNGTIGTGGAAGSTALYGYWCRATSTSQASPVVADSGDHQVGVILTFRGCIATGTPYDVSNVDAQGTAQTAFTIPGVTTTVDNDLIVLAISNGGDAATNQMTVPPVNANLSNIVERIDTQPAAVVNTALKFGPYTGTSGLGAIGPGGDTGAPRYGVLGINPHSMTATQRQTIVDLADQLDIILFVTTCDTTSTFGANTTTGGDGGNGGLDTTKYNAKIQKVHDQMPEIADALSRGRAVSVFSDEPYHHKWDDALGNPTWTPTKLNACARIHKTLFGQGCATICRGDLDKLSTGNGAGWVNLPLPVGGYDAMDYGTFQYEGPSAQAHLDFAAALATARAQAASVNIGVFPTINLWAGGNHVTTGGVPACWDYQNTGTSSGVIAGSVNGAPSPYSNGQPVDCATWTATPSNQRKTLVCSPDWIRHIIDTVYNDADIPWLGFWIYATSGLSDYGWMGPLQGDSPSTRHDIIDALDYAITKCATRPSFNGFRTLKS